MLRIVPTGAALAVALALLAGCDPPLPEGRARRVILITCDTLRADRLGAYGYGRPTSPRVDAFAADAAVYEEAYSTAPWTGPALAALHTGLLPDEVGVPGGNRYPLPAEAVTLAERARDAGFATAAVVSNWVLRRPPPVHGDAGLAQGFAHWDQEMTRREPNREHYERTADDTADAALRWLERARREGTDRFFLWVHFQDPHGPYLPAAEHAAPFARPATDEPELPAGTSHKGLDQIPAYQVVGDERAPEAYRARYDGEIRAFDEHFGRLLDGLRAAGWYDDSLIVLTADHGESLGEHGYWFCHGENVYREVVRVPLVVRLPGGGARRVSEVAGHLDLWPTVLEALGLPPAANRGTSLFAERLPAERVQLQSMGFPGRPNRWTAVSDGRWRLVEHGGRTWLFDVAADPDEERDLAASDRAAAQRLAERARAYLALHARAPLPARRLAPDPEHDRGLRATGYAGDEDGASEEH